MKGDHKLHLISAFLWEPLLYRLKERLRNCFAAAGCCDPPPKSDKRREVAGDTVCPFWSCWCYRCCDPPRMLWSTQGNLRPRVTMEKRKLETKSVPFDVVIHHPLLFSFERVQGQTWSPDIQLPPCSCHCWSLVSLQGPGLGATQRDKVCPWIHSNENTGERDHHASFWHGLGITTNKTH